MRDPNQPHPPQWLQPARTWVMARPGGRVVWRGGIGVLGLAIVTGGLLLIPLPGPGWAIVFLGLAVWATEFVWAQRLLRFGRRLLKDWTAWIKRQPRWLQALIGLVGLAVPGRAGLSRLAVLHQLRGGPAAAAGHVSWLRFPAQPDTVPRD